MGNTDRGTQSALKALCATPYHASHLKVPVSTEAQYAVTRKIVCGLRRCQRSTSRRIEAGPDPLEQRYFTKFSPRGIGATEPRRGSPVSYHGPSRLVPFHGFLLRRPIRGRATTAPRHRRTITGEKKRPLSAFSRGPEKSPM